MADDHKVSDALDQAQRLFKQYYASCFWHMKPDLIVGKEILPAIVRGLCTYGGWSGLRAAASLHGQMTEAMLKRAKSRADSASRFFPATNGSLHAADLAVDRAFTLSNPARVTDFIDILEIHRTYLSLGALLWAAGGKSSDLTPWTMLDLAKRRMKFRNEDLVSANLVQSVRLPELKEAWLAAAEQAGELIARLPLAEAGCLYLTPTMSPVTPDPTSPEFASLIRHFGSVRGAWPVLAKASH